MEIQRGKVCFVFYVNEQHLHDPIVQDHLVVDQWEMSRIVHVIVAEHFQILPGFHRIGRPQYLEHLRPGGLTRGDATPTWGWNRCACSYWW